MPLLNDIHSIIVSAASANFSAHSYTEVFASVAASPTVNGVVIGLAAGQSIKIKVKSISATANVFLLGENINTLMDAPILGG
jgi:small-conductance mechanosensitive channel